jgi:hypothetical protein
LVNSLAPTGETIETLKGVTLAKDPDGYDPEGLVAMPDGSFWVSDEHGPFVTHFTAQGKELPALAVQDGSRSAAGGAEEPGAEPRHGGLTLTPDRPPPASPTVRSRRSRTTPS